MHKQITDFLSERQACGDDTACREKDAEKYIALSQDAYAALRACETEACRKENFKEIQEAKPLLRKLDPTTNTRSDGHGQLFSLQSSETISRSMYASMQWQSALEGARESCGSDQTCVTREARCRFQGGCPLGACLWAVVDRVPSEACGCCSRTATGSWRRCVPGTRRRGRNRAIRARWSG